MRKILLASTALVAVAGISAASAEITLSGGSDVSYTAVSDDITDNATIGDNGNSMQADTDLSASYSSTTDTGLSISVSYDIDGDSGSVSIGGDWGTFTYDDGEEAMGTGMGDADVVPEMRIVGGNELVYDGTEQIGGGLIAYSNSFSGIDFAVGLSNGGTTSEANETSYGVAYSSSVNGADVSIGYAAANTGAANTAAASPDSTATSVSVGVTVGNISLSMANNTLKTDRNDGTSAAGFKDLKSTNVGVTYAVSDSLTISAASVAADGDVAATTNFKYDESAYGFEYAVASGMTLSAGYSDFTQSGGGGTDVSGTGTTVKLAISF